LNVFRFMQRAILRINRSPGGDNKATMVKKALIFLISGAEETELVITTDLLRRADVEVVIGSVTSGDEPVECVQHMRIMPDVALERLEDETFDAVIVPGGPGAHQLTDSLVVQRILKRHAEMNRLVCAICSGPTVFNKLQLGFGKAITAHPKYEKELTQNYKFKSDSVVVDGNFVTSQGPGTAFEFALKIIELIYDDASKAKKLAKELVISY